jgi:hypothetical protein
MRPLDFLFFLTCRCARHGVTAYMQLRLCYMLPESEELLFYCFNNGFLRNLEENTV